jgi:hypothetical protein
MRERINNLNKEVEQSRERKTGEDIKSSKYYFLNKQTKIESDFIGHRQGFVCKKRRISK